MTDVAEGPSSRVTCPGALLDCCRRWHFESFDLATSIGKAMLTMLAAVVELERSNIKARQMAGILRAKAEGKALRRVKETEDAVAACWRKENGASIVATAA